MLAWVAMSEVAQRRDELEDAVWHMQRAFELATDNTMVARELCRLQGRLTGTEPERLQLTETALARLHLRGDHLKQAIAELRDLIEQHPDRLDLKVALLEALWRDGQRLRASQVCQEVLDDQFYNLKANLVLGEIWCSSGRTDEGDRHLERAEALDPENKMAQELFGSASPRPPNDPQIVPLDYEKALQDQTMDWTVALEEAVPADESLEEEQEQIVEPEEAVPPGSYESPEVRSEIPAWLHEADEEPEIEPPVEPMKASERGVEPDAHPPSEAEGEEEVPELAAPNGPAEEPMDAESMADEEGLDWLSELEEEEVTPSSERELEKGEIPDWLAEVRAGMGEGTAIQDEAAPRAAEPERAEIPDWLRDLAPSAPEPSMAEETDLAAIFDQEIPPEGIATEKPEIGKPELEEPEVEERELERPEAEPLETGAPEPEEPEELEAEEAARERLEYAARSPAWVEEDELPSRDDALAWLARLAEGDEELPTEEEAKGEPRLAEILDRRDIITEEEQAEEELRPRQPEEGPHVPEREAFGWTAFGESEEVTPEAEEAMPSEEAEPAIAPAAGAEGPSLEEPGLVPEGKEPAEEVPEARAAEEEKEVEEFPAPEVEPEVPEAARAEREVPFIEELAPDEDVPAEELLRTELFVGEEEEESPVPPAVPPEAPEVSPEALEARPSEMPAPAFEEPAPVEEAPPAEERPPEETAPAEEAPEAQPPAVAEEVEVEEPAAAEVEAPDVAELEAVAEEARAEEPVPGEVVPTEEVPEPEPSEAVDWVSPEAVSLAEALEEAPEDLERFIAERRAYTKEHGEDVSAHLELGRVLWQADRRADAVAAYQSLIERGMLLDDVAADLEDYAEQWPDAMLQQALGDAYMRADRLHEALEMYRQALETL
jgi:hypothetical protein